MIIFLLCICDVRLRAGFVYFCDSWTTCWSALEHLRPIVASINTLIGSCENMEATYCVGNDVDVCRMFDQYLYKVQTFLRFIFVENFLAFLPDLKTVLLFHFAPFAHNILIVNFPIKLNEYLYKSLEAIT